MQISSSLAHPPASNLSEDRSSPRSIQLEATITAPTTTPDVTPVATPIKPRDYKQLINPRHANMVKFAFSITALAFIALALPYKACRVWGITVLSAVAYGIINDMFACRVCPEYFTVGHLYDKQNLRYRLVQTLDPNINALVFGTVITAPLATVGGGVMAVAAHLADADEKLLLIGSIVACGLTLLVGDVGSRIAKASVERNPRHIYFTVPLKFQARWHANNVRNIIGYIGLISAVVIACLRMDTLHHTR